MKRIGNVIGTPVEPTSSSASGCFRITAQQQRNINTTFPKKDVRGDNPRDVSIMAFTYSVLSGGTYAITGEMILRFAGEEDLIPRSDYINSAEDGGVGNIGNTGFATNMAQNLFTRPNDNGFSAIAYSAIITNHTTGQTEEFHVSSDLACKTQRVLYSTSDSSGLPRFESPLTFDDNHKTISLSSFRTGSGLNGTYTAQVFTKSAQMGERNPNNPIIGDPTAANYSNSAICANGVRAVDLVLVAGGGAGGRVLNTNNNADFGCGSGGAGGVMVAYHVPVSAGVTYNISVGQGGDTLNGTSAGAWNGTGSSAIGCFVPGGGHGAFIEYVQNSAGNGIIAAGDGGSGGGSISRGGQSNLARQNGHAGLSTISASATFVVGGKYELYGFDGGHVPGGNWLQENVSGDIEAASANSSYAEILGTGQARNKLMGNFGNQNVGGIGGAAGGFGTTVEGQFDGQPGIYISWATPDIVNTTLFSPTPVSQNLSLPQINGLANYNVWVERHIGDVNNAGNTPRTQTQRGYYAGSGSNERDEMMGKGGGGYGRRVRSSWSQNQANYSVTLADGSTTFTHSCDGISGTGGGGGAVWSDNCNNTNSLPYAAGGKGGSGIVLIRLPRKQLTKVTRSVDDQLYPDGDYVIYVWRQNSGGFIRFDI